MLLFAASANVGYCIFTCLALPCLALPCLRGGQALTPAQCWGRISSAQCASPKVTAGYK